MEEKVVGGEEVKELGSPCTWVLKSPNSVTEETAE